MGAFDGFGFGSNAQPFGNLAPTGGFAQPQGGFGGGGGGLAGLLAGLGSTNPVTAGLFAGGQSLLGGLGGLLTGPSAQERRQEEAFKQGRQVFALAQNRLGQSVLDPNQYLAQYMQSLAPRFNRQAEAINARLGLDSGLAQKGLAAGRQSVEAGLFADISKLNAQLTSQQDQNLLGLMAQLTRGVQ